MDKQLIKIYVIIAAALLFLTAFLPMVIGKTSGLLKDIAVKLNLLIYGKQQTESSIDKIQGNIIFIFDDGWITQYTNGFKVLKHYDLKANIAVVSNRVGKKEYMNYKELAEVYKNGWDLLNHTYDHPDLRTLNEKEQASEINKGRDWLSHNLFQRGKDIIVFPGSFYTNATLEIVKKNNYTAGCSFDGIWLAKNDSFLNDVDVCNLCSSESTGQAISFIDKAIKNKSTVIFVVNKIEKITDDTQMQYEPQEFMQIVNYISEHKEALNVLTMTEFLQSRTDVYNKEF